MVKVPNTLVIGLIICWGSFATVPILPGEKRVQSCSQLLTEFQPSMLRYLATSHRSYDQYRHHSELFITSDGESLFRGIPVLKRIGAAETASFVLFGLPITNKPPGFKIRQLEAVSDPTFSPIEGRIYGLNGRELFSVDEHLSYVRIHFPWGQPRAFAISTPNSTSKNETLFVMTEEGRVYWAQRSRLSDDFSWREMAQGFEEYSHFSTLTDRSFIIAKEGEPKADGEPLELLIWSENKTPQRFLVPGHWLQTMRPLVTSQGTQVYLYTLDSHLNPTEVIIEPKKQRITYRPIQEKPFFPHSYRPSKRTTAIRRKANDFKRTTEKYFFSAVPQGLAWTSGHSHKIYSGLLAKENYLNAQNFLEGFLTSKTLSFELPERVVREVPALRVIDLEKRYHAFRWILYHLQFPGSRMSERLAEITKIRDPLEQILFCYFSTNKFMNELLFNIIKDPRSPAADSASIQKLSSWFRSSAGYVAGLLEQSIEGHHRPESFLEQFISDLAVLCMEPMTKDAGPGFRFRFQDFLLKHSSDRFVEVMIQFLKTSPIKVVMEEINHEIRSHSDGQPQ